MYKKSADPIIKRLDQRFFVSFWKVYCLFVFKNGKEGKLELISDIERI